MADYPNQPRVDDAVKGGQTSLPVDAAILPIGAMITFAHLTLPQKTFLQ